MQILENVLDFKFMQANAKLDGDKPKIKTPITFDGLKNTINNSSVSSYDGFRMVVQKQINLNTIVSHLYAIISFPSLFCILYRNFSVVTGWDLKWLDSRYISIGLYFLLIMARS